MKTLLSALAFSALAMPLAAQAEFDAYRVTGGRVVLTFHETVLEQAGLEVVGIEQTADVLSPIDLEVMEGDLISFNIQDDSDMLFLRYPDGGTIVPYGVISGGVDVDGGFAIRSTTNDKLVDFHNFTIQRQFMFNDGPGGAEDPDYLFMSTAGDVTGRDIRMCYVKTYSGPAQTGYQDPGDHDLQVVWIKSWDLVINPELARKLGRPELEGTFFGVGKLEGRIEPYAGDWEMPRGQNPYTPYTGDTADPAAGDGTFLDVSLGILSSMTQVGHVGSFGSGRTGMSMATTSCNLGDVNVPWISAGGFIGSNMAPSDHPGIGMNLFRESNGRFEQVGTSWVKHGFFALSNSQCIPCQNPSNGTFLGVGCSDTYGTGNNADRTWLGPRDEWDPFAGTWECEGSFFDVGPDGTFPEDCVRSQGGSGFGSVDHRLEAFDVDLNNPGAEYYYEAIYLVRGEENPVNNIGSRRTVMGSTGSSYTFTNGGALIEGPAVLRWGDMNSEANLKGYDGPVVLAVDVTDNGNGTWRYEYALYNWRMNRQVRRFQVPSAGVITDLYFHDTDGDASNDWVPSLAENNVTWEFPDVFVSGHKVAGPLIWGTLYNFGFTSTVGPAARDAQVEAQNTGPGGNLLFVSTMAPAKVNLSASSATPFPGGSVSLSIKNVTDHGWFAVTEAAGVPINPPLLIPVGPLPNVSGEVNISGTVPLSATGFRVKMLAADVTTSPIWVIDFSNSMELDLP